MTLRTHTIVKKNEQHNQEWIWEETPEVKEALDRLHQNMREAKKGDS